MAVALLVVTAAVLFLPRPGPRTLTVDAAASEVLLNVSDISQVGWGEWGHGIDGTAAWRQFAVHNELILATLNVTLWVHPDTDAAHRAMGALVANVSYAVQDGSVPGSDGSSFWVYNFGQYGGIVVRRYNVVFLMSAHLESSFQLTQSDFAHWAGWQLTKVEALAR